MSMLEKLFLFSHPNHKGLTLLLTMPSPGYLIALHSPTLLGQPVLSSSQAQTGSLHGLSLDTCGKTEPAYLLAALPGSTVVVGQVLLLYMNGPSSIIFSVVQ